MAPPSVTANRRSQDSPAQQFDANHFLRLKVTYFFKIKKTESSQQTSVPEIQGIPFLFHKISQESVLKMLHDYYNSVNYQHYCGPQTAPLVTNALSKQNVSVFIRSLNICLSVQKIVRKKDEHAFERKQPNNLLMRSFWHQQ